MNPNNAAYHAATDNHADQLNPNNAEFKGDTGKGENKK
jgi:hypothetical protein